MSDDTMTVKTSDMKELLAQNRELAKKVDLLSQKVEGGTEEYKPTLLTKAVKEHVVRVTFIGDKPVIGFANRGTETKPLYIYEKPDPNDSKSRILYVDVMLQGDEKAIPMRYIELLQEGDHRPCKVKCVEKKEWEEIQGSVEAQVIEGENYAPTKLGFEVPVGVTGAKYTYTVELPDGSDLVIKDEYVNIS